MMVPEAAAEQLEESTSREETRYDKAFRETRRVLDECIRVLMVKERLEGNSTRRMQIRQKRRNLDRQRSALVRANIAFHAGTATMTPPAPELVAEISALSREAAALTAERTTASAALALSAKVLQKFGEIQGD